MLHVEQSKTGARIAYRFPFAAMRCLRHLPARRYHPVPR
jgi:hypothetical protein